MQFAIPARWAAGVVLGAGLVRMGSAGEMSLPALARQADRIYAGTVRETHSRREAATGLVYTEVRFGDLEVLKGQKAASAGRATHSLRVAGGRDSDGTFVQVAGVPRFYTGERYLIFEKQGAGTLCPLVGWEQGCYRLARDGARGRAVLDANDIPIVALRDGRIERPLPPRATELQNLFGAAVPGDARPARPADGPWSGDAVPRPAGAAPTVIRHIGSAGRRLARSRSAVTRGAMPAATFLAELRRMLAKG